MNAAFEQNVRRALPYVAAMPSLPGDQARVDAFPAVIHRRRGSMRLPAIRARTTPGPGPRPGNSAASRNRARKERGILYNTFGSSASDFYAGDRPGDNLYGNSLVALEAATGKYLGHFQAVHHDQWDMDLPPAPTLLDVRINGKLSPILAQGGKTGFVYILNRMTGDH